MKHGHDQTFGVATVLIVKFDLTYDEALQIITTWNQRCVPPWDSGDLERKLREAMKIEEPRGELALSLGS